jgi:hypothetical protein
MSKKQNPFSRFYHKLCEARWFYTFTAGCTATIVGISLTFGINSCRESRRVKQEAQESILQAVHNLHSRSKGIDQALDLLARQDSLYMLINYYQVNHIEISDSLATEFIKTINENGGIVSDTSFEKIFRESYQLWQELDHDDLTNKISLGYRIANYLEEYCQSSRQSLVQKLEDTDFNQSLWYDDSRVTTDVIAHNKKLYYFMGSRYFATRHQLIEAQFLHKTLADIDSICLAVGYGECHESHFVTVTSPATK